MILSQRYAENMRARSAARRGLFADPILKAVTQSCISHRASRCRCKCRSILMSAMVVASDTIATCIWVRIGSRVFEIRTRKLWRIGHVEVRRICTPSRCPGFLSTVGQHLSASTRPAPTISVYRMDVSSCYDSPCLLTLWSGSSIHVLSRSLAFSLPRPAQHSATHWYRGTVSGLLFVWLYVVCELSGSRLGNAAAPRCLRVRVRVRALFRKIRLRNYRGTRR